MINAAAVTSGSLTGGAGIDIFDFDFASHTGTTAATRDTISQFQQGLEIIDLAGIDALPEVGGKQAFTFIGTAAHTGAGATLRYGGGALNTIVRGDVAADGIADVSILLEGAYTLNAGISSSEASSNIRLNLMSAPGNPWGLALSCGGTFR